MANLTDLSQELWADVKGYEGIYQISTLGNVRSLGSIRIIKKVKQFYSMRLLKQFKINNGYYCVSLWKDGIKSTFPIHRLIADAFIPNPQNKLEVNHINGIKTDNRIENLEWVTRLENMAHAVRTGLFIASRRKKRKLIQGELFLQ